MAAEGNHRKPARRRKPGRERSGPTVQVRRLHRRDLNKVWDFLKRSFRDVNLETVEYQRPRSKKRFFETYEEEGVEQLLFVVDGEIVAYTECTFEIIGSDTWINPRYFEKRDMRPLYVEELAVHPDWHGRGVGSFVLEQIQHLAKVRGLTHLVLEVAENNTHAMHWYRKRGFRKLDASVFMAYAVDVAPELLPPRALENDRVSVAEERVEMVAPVAPLAKGGKRPVEKKLAEKPVEKKLAEKPVEKKLAEKPVEKKPAQKKPVEKKLEAVPVRVRAGFKRERTAAADALAVMTGFGPGPRGAGPEPGNGAKEEAKNGQRRPLRAETPPPIPSAPEPVPGRRRPS